MNEWQIHGVRILKTVILTGLMLAGSLVGAHAETPKQDNPALILPPSPEDQSVLKRRLQTAKRDIEAFRVFAENFSTDGSTKALAQLQKPVDDFLTKHVDNLLTQSLQQSNLETTRLTAEIMYIKVRLLLNLGRDDAASKVNTEMKKRFGSYQKISVELPGKTTTLDEAMRLLDEELARTKKQGV